MKIKLGYGNTLIKCIICNKVKEQFVYAISQEGIICARCALKLLDEGKAEFYNEIGDEK